jgi:replicative DNA helicase
MSNNGKEFNPEHSFYHPEQVSRLTVQALKKLRQGEDIRLVTGIEDIDKVMNPMRSGYLVPILGSTNNYKSAFMSIICSNAVSQLQNENEIIVIANWEDSVEDKGIWDLAGMTRIDTTAMDRGELSDSEWKRLLDASIDRAELPIYYIGHSDQDMRRRPRLTLPQVWNILDHVYDYHGKRARLIALDYLQRIRPHGQRRDWRVAMMENVDMAKDMAIAFSCPVILGTQAGRSVMSQAGVKLPQMHHAQETSNIEQSSNAFFSLCIPAKTEMLNDSVEFMGRNFTVKQELLFAGLLKQKRGPAPAYFAFHIDYSTHTLHPYEKQRSYV